MNIEIIYLCDNCEHDNKMNLGTDGFVNKEYEFFTFSDAHRHMIEHPNHWIDTILREKV